MDTPPTPEQVARVTQSIYVGLGFGVLLCVLFYLSNRSAEGEPTRWQQWWAIFRAWFVNRYPPRNDAVMFSNDEDDGDDQPVRPPVRSAPAPMSADSASACESGAQPRTPEDTDALLSVLKMLPADTAIIRKMVYYRDREIKLGNTPGKAATIKAATGLSKSGDPKSNYAKYAAIYDALFSEPDPATKYPTRAAQIRGKWKPEQVNGKP